MRAYFLLSVLFALGCSGALVPRASQGGSSVFDADSPFPDFTGGSDAPDDGSDDADTSSWDTGSWDTGSWDTGSGEPGACPFSGDSTAFAAYYEIQDDDCDWGTEGFGGDVVLYCNDDGTFTLEDGIFETTAECTLNGISFVCSAESEASLLLQGSFDGESYATGTWYFDLGSCYGSGEFVWN
jgi:hypothetical protein